MHFDPYLGAHSESMFAGLWRSAAWVYYKIFPTAEQCLDNIERNIGQLESVPAELRNSDMLHGMIRYRFRQIGKFDTRYHKLCLKLFWQPHAESLPGITRYSELRRRIEQLNQSFDREHA